MSKRLSEAKLSVLIMTPEKEIWSGSADAISSKNSDGPFDILPGHANFITLVREDPISITTEEGVQEFKFDQVVLSVQSNSVRIYANI